MGLVAVVIDVVIVIVAQYIIKTPPLTFRAREGNSIVIIVVVVFAQRRFRTPSTCI